MANFRIHPKNWVVFCAGILYGNCQQLIYRMSALIVCTALTGRTRLWGVTRLQNAATNVSTASNKYQYCQQLWCALRQLHNVGKKFCVWWGNFRTTASNSTTMMKYNFGASRNNFGLLWRAMRQLRNKGKKLHNNGKQLWCERETTLVCDEPMRQLHNIGKQLH